LLLSELFPVFTTLFDITQRSAWYHLQGLSHSGCSCSQPTTNSKHWW